MTTIAATRITVPACRLMCVTQPKLRVRHRHTTLCLDTPVERGPGGLSSKRCEQLAAFGVDSRAQEPRRFR
jgi:hypothetical protein